MPTSHSLQIFNTTKLALPISENTAHKLLEAIQKGEEVIFESVEVAYVDEQEIVRINKEFLSRDYITDIISFRYDDDSYDNEGIEGTLYCCLPRIIEQADEFGEDKTTETYRILAHGLLHLCGYDDQTDSEKAKMTELENLYLSLILK